MIELYDVATLKNIFPRNPTAIIDLIGSGLAERLENRSPVEIVGERFSGQLNPEVIRELTGGDTINVGEFYQNEIDNLSSVTWLIFTNYRQSNRMFSNRL